MKGRYGSKKQMKLGQNGTSKKKKKKKKRKGVVIRIESLLLVELFSSLFMFQ